MGQDKHPQPKEEEEEDHCSLDTGHLTPQSSKELYPLKKILSIQYSYVPWK